MIFSINLIIEFILEFEKRKLLSNFIILEYGKQAMLRMSFNFF
jgi:hypothetical protein